jgi:predicted nucleic acid-binding protein
VRRVVFDANVLVTALCSRRGAAFRLLARIGSGAFQLAISVPLIFEYEDVLTRELAAVGYTTDDVSAVVDYVCSVAMHQEIFFLWRPVLRDPSDDLLLELAVAANCEAIVTHNVRDFDRARNLGVRAYSPGTFLYELEGAK